MQVIGLLLRYRTLHTSNSLPKDSSYQIAPVTRKNLTAFNSYANSASLIHMQISRVHIQGESVSAVPAQRATMKKHNLQSNCFDSQAKSEQDPIENHKIEVPEAVPSALHAQTREHRYISRILCDV